MGRMNDIEKKKTLFQVLFRLKEMYLKFQLILEWTKVLNEHTALKTFQFKAKTAKSNLSRLIGGIFHDSNNLLTTKHAEPKFKALKDLFTVSDLTPSYFAPSIEALVPKSLEKLSENEEKSWLSTLDSLLRTEVCKNVINIPRKDFRLLSICDGKAKILFLNLFEFEFTLVPSIGDENLAGEALNFSWFILGVQVDSMKSTFKNSLTGIFQFKYNNNSKSSANSQFFKSIISDCTKYVELFYYEKMFSQFAFLSNVYGKSICSFQKSPLGDWFKFKPWFMKSEEGDILVSFSNETGLKAEGYSAKAILIPSISFDEREAQNIFESLFESFYIDELKQFLNDQIQNGIINNFIVRNRFTLEMELFENFSMTVRIDPLSKKVKFVSKEIHVNFEESLENSIINFNSEAFKEIIVEIKKEIFKAAVTDEFSIISCPEISSKTGYCLLLRGEVSLAISIDFTSKTNQISIKFWSISMNFLQNGFIEIKFKEISENGNYFEPPRTAVQLDMLLQNQKSELLKISSKFSFEKLIKSCGIHGEYLEQNLFKICSFGLPNCVKSITLSSSSQLIYGKLEFDGLKRDLLEIGPAKQSEIQILLSQIKGTVKLFTIFEHFNFIEESPEAIFVVDSFEPLRLKYKNMTFYLNEWGKVQVFIDESNSVILEYFIESDKFNIYEFYEKITSKSERRDSTRKDEEGSPDLTWLSDSFM